MWTIVGLTDYGNFVNELNIVLTRKLEKPLATHVLQFAFNGYSGFRWPVVYFGTNTASAYQIYPLVWEAVDKLGQFGFSVDYIGMDGAATNRAFINMHFKDNPRSHNFTTMDPYDNTHEIVFMQDIKHTIKKVRNSMYSSREENKWKSAVSERYLLINDQPVLWDMFEAAASLNERYGIRLHRKLTREHIYLDSMAKMRNSFAEQVLSDDMLSLVQALKESGEYNGEPLDELIGLLHHTSDMVTFFHDTRPVVGMSDPRLQTLRKNLDYFNKWELSVMENNDLTKAQKTRRLITQETRDDLNSAILGCLQICSNATKMGISVIPAYLNCDPIENTFCQQRGINNGMNTNPTLLQYGPGINSIILGESSVSRKSNSGVKAHSYKALVPCTLNPAKKRKSIRV